MRQLTKAVISALLCIGVFSASPVAFGKTHRLQKAKIEYKNLKYAKGGTRGRAVTRDRLVEGRSRGQIAHNSAPFGAPVLRSNVALVVDQVTQEILLQKNEQAVLPIASITKLMTALIVREAGLPMDEPITITQDDVDTEKGSRSRLRVGTVLSRGELLHLALMSSENRAANALGRNFPGGIIQFVERMNTRARELGMKDTLYVEPTGLSSKNRSSAKDLALLVQFSAQDRLLGELSTSTGFTVAVGRQTMQFNNTNRLVKNPSWDIGLQKTGYISEAGQCLVMQATIGGRQLVMVFLDSVGKLSRLGDAERVRRWVEVHLPAIERSSPAIRLGGLRGGTPEFDS